MARLNLIRSLAFCGLAVLFLLWLKTSVFFVSERWYKKPALCSTPTDVLNDMRDMLFIVNHTLIAKLMLPYFICYGTLWGVVRTGDILPWDNNIDVCLLDDDVSSIDENYFANAFVRAGITISYDSKEGVYNMNYRKAVGQITVFQIQANVGTRVGWAVRVRSVGRMLGILSDSLSFPSRLIETPFPKQKFLGADFPVPHDGYEILKYMYPDDWHIAVIPPGC